MSSWMDGIDNVQLSSRLPAPPLGSHEATLVSVREHQSTRGAGIGLLVEVEIDGVPYAWRINLGGKFPEYGQRDAKQLCAALLGIEDPARAATEVTKAVTTSILSDDQPCKGNKFQITVFESKNVNPKNGEPYRTVRCRALSTGEASGVVALPPAPPAPPPVATFPPAGWVQHP